jgi:ABC-type uncharacterized transport system ATPase subunit
MSINPLLQIDGVTKAFPGVVANRDVSLTVAEGSIHALLGENGAGKSTLVKMIYGVMRPDTGSMLIDGQTYEPAKPADARTAGIGMVFQHFSLFEAMTVIENIALGLPASETGPDLEFRIRETSTAYGLRINPQNRIDDLSVGEKQRVEIVRCLLQNPRLLIMDEPTSVLTPQEAERLFEILERLRGKGCSILYISHKLEEIRTHCDAATVLRRGEVVASCDPKQETARSLAAMMIGDQLSTPVRRQSVTGEVRLSVNNLSLPSPSEFGIALSGVSFDVRGGEILGIGGVAGNGQTELMEALTGERRTEAEAIVIDGVPMGDRGPVVRRRRGMAFVPEERLGHAAAAGLSLAENTLIAGRADKGLVERGFLKVFHATGFAESIISRFRVATSGTGAMAGSLSGGNLQKFVVGREIMQSPSVLIVAQPTWGVDAGSAADIHRALAALALEGAAILVISQDLEELMHLSDRFAALNEGRLTEARETASLSVAEIGLMMGGSAAEDEAA